MAVIGPALPDMTAAIQAAKFGKKIAVVERSIALREACINTGAIPSKTLREAVLRATRSHMRSRGVTLRLGEEVEEVTKSSEGKVRASLKADSGRLTRATRVSCRNHAWPLKNSSPKVAEKTLRQEALQTILSVFLDIILSLKFSLFCEEWSFSKAQAKIPVDGQTGS
jgi:pyruvate/2-oxoglutarate dehydrogenase complex dihydrolipoamide dehydrogenase (E3) component